MAKISELTQATHLGLNENSYILINEPDNNSETGFTTKQVSIAELNEELIENYGYAAIKNSIVYPVGENAAHGFNFNDYALKTDLDGCAIIEDSIVYPVGDSPAHGFDFDDYALKTDLDGLVAYDGTSFTCNNTVVPVGKVGYDSSDGFIDVENNTTIPVGNVRYDRDGNFRNVEDHNAIISTIGNVFYDDEDRTLNYRDNYGSLQELSVGGGNVSYDGTSFTYDDGYPVPIGNVSYDSTKGLIYDGSNSVPVGNVSYDGTSLIYDGSYPVPISGNVHYDDNNEVFYYDGCADNTVPIGNVSYDDYNGVLYYGDCAQNAIPVVGNVHYDYNNEIFYYGDCADNTVPIGNVHYDDNNEVLYYGDCADNTITPGITYHYGGSGSSLVDVDDSLIPVVFYENGHFQQDGYDIPIGNVKFDGTNLTYLHYDNGQLTESTIDLSSLINNN